MACPLEASKTNCGLSRSHIVPQEGVRYGSPTVHGHFWTLAGHLSRTLRSPGVPSSAHVVFEVPDARFGSVRLTGRLAAAPNARTLLVLVHGLGGSSQSPYLFQATALAHEMGVSTLRLNLRGADLRGEDFYHAGLSSDLHAVIGHNMLSDYSHIAVLGYSLGGHVSLCFASENKDPRLHRVATLCSPLDLSLTATSFDSARAILYRGHVLRGLKAMYRAVAARRDVPVPVSDADRIVAIRDWDEQIVAPRHGYASAADYYARASAGPRLTEIQVPTLFAYTRHDPMVSIETLHEALQGRSAQVAVWEIERGGHIGFPVGQTIPSSLLLELAGPKSVDAQLVRWLLTDLR